MNVALVLSGGTGSRLGDRTPKQYLKVANKMIIMYSLEMLLQHDRIDAVQIVAAKEWRKKIEEAIACPKTDKPVHFSEPGENRQLSIYNGLCDIQKYADETAMIMVHDAARPMLTGEMVADYFDKAQGHDGLLPVLPMKDTVYMSMNGSSITSLLDRSRVFAGQAPEIFVFGKYREANERLLPDQILKINGSTEPAVMAGMDIVMVPGEETNFKITTQEDLMRFQSIVCS